MNKPDWCPQKIWDEAIKVEGGSNPMLVERIARAILAAEQREREACAQAAFAFNEDVPDHFAAMPFSTDAAAGWASARIAASIRNRGEHHD